MPMTDQKVLGDQRGVKTKQVEFLKDERLAAAISAYLDGDNSTAFSVNGLGLGKGEFDANAGINWVFDDAGALFVGYQGTYRSSYQSHGISLGLRLEF